MTDPMTLPAAADALGTFIRALLGQADDAWAHRTGPGPVLQALFARLDPEDGTAIRRAFRLSLMDAAGQPQARAIVSGAIRTRFESEIGGDEALCAALAHAYGQWPHTARILHVIRLLRAPAGSGAWPADMDAPVRALIAHCAAPETHGDAPFEMSHGFLHAAAGSDRLPEPLRTEALAAADRLLLQFRAQVPPSVLVRSIGRGAIATRRSGTTAWARACINAAEMSGSLSDPALVHVAALAVFRETGVGLGGALALLKDAAAAHPAGPSAEAFQLATSLTGDGLFCRGLLVRAPSGRTRAKPAPEGSAPRPRAGRKKTPAVALPAEPGRGDAMPPPDKERPRRPGAEARPTLRQRQGPPPGDTEAGMRAATRRAASRLLQRLRTKNAAKDTPS